MAIDASILVAPHAAACVFVLRLRHRGAIAAPADPAVADPAGDLIALALRCALTAFGVDVKPYVAEELEKLASLGLSR
jgi:hypothetical protein